MRRLVLLACVLALASSAAAKPYLRKPKRGFQMRVSPYTIEPGQDLEVCEYRRLPNSKPMDVSGFKLRMPEGAHHFVIWSYGGSREDDSTFPQGPFPSVACTGAASDDFVPQLVIPIQQPNARFRFPKGVALKIDPHQQVWLNPHMRNIEPEPLTPDIRFNFYTAPRGSVKHEAQGLIAGNITGIHIPAGGDQTLTAEWTAPVNVNLVYLATHQHRLGTYANIQMVDAAGPHTIYENTDWMHPRSYWPKPVIHLAKGDKMRITCTWHNTDDHEVTFGVKTTDEMCFILGFYYRDPGDTEPVPFGQCAPSKRGLVCPFAPAVN